MGRLFYLVRPEDTTFQDMDSLPKPTITSQVRTPPSRTWTAYPSRLSSIRWEDTTFQDMDSLPKPTTSHQVRTPSSRTWLIFFKKVYCTIYCLYTIGDALLLWPLLHRVGSSYSSGIFLLDFLLVKKLLSNTTRKRKRNITVLGIKDGHANVIIAALPARAAGCSLFFTSGVYILMMYRKFWYNWRNIS